MSDKYKKELKKLSWAYNKKLTELHKQSFDSASTPIDYFVTYLHYLRDHHILTSEPSQDDLPFIALEAALSEYNDFKNCIFKYYKVTKTNVTKIIDAPDEEVRKKFSEERNFHWVNFWKLVTLNIESWSFNV